MFLIYFGEATFDQIEKDTKMTMETMVGVIGGTMGLFTGFSILSGVEIVYYLLKLVFSSKALRTLMASINSKMESLLKRDN